MTFYLAEGFINMQIQKISFLPQNYTLLKKKSASHQANKENYSYNPVAYKDYNINFGARLFRTPENFYAQPFNKNNMPNVMMEYLNADYEDRQKMPPAQMLKLVFDDINEAKNLEQVKWIYSGQPGGNPKEPLFESLTDVPNRKARTGILAEIELMRENGKTLFKDGTDNLGYYILKKIYTEAKTLKEINEDFQKDVSVHYQGLSPIEYDTLRAYGIKFPNIAFWKSLTATREEFPYTYKPRKSCKYEHDMPMGQSNTEVVPPAKKRFGNIKDWQLDKLADALGKGNGSANDTKKHLKKLNIRDEASLNFVAKYMGEINSVVLEKLHVSPEMKDFFENYDNLSQSQKQKFSAYWQDPERRELRSIIMKDTIKLFFDAYGVDGQNDEFRELIDYARGIKPARIAKLQEHDRIQQEYEEMFAELDKQESINSEANKQLEKKSVDEILETAKSQYDADSFVFDTDKGKIIIVANLKQAFDEAIKEKFAYMPEHFVNRYARFVKSSPIVDEAYILTTLLSDKDIALPSDDRLMPKEEVLVKTTQLHKEFIDNNAITARALQQALIDSFIRLADDEDEKSRCQIFKLELFDFPSLYERVSDDLKGKLKADKNYINDKYNEYRRPLSDSEARKICIAINELLKNYDLSKSIFAGKRGYSSMSAVYYSLSKYLNNKRLSSNDFKDNMINYIKSYGGSARFFIDKNVSRQQKQAKLEQFLLDYCGERPAELFAYAAIDKEGLEYLKINAPEIYKILQKSITVMPQWTGF